LEGCFYNAGYVSFTWYNHGEFFMSDRARWIVDNTRYDPNNAKGTKVEYAFDHLIDEIEKALTAERQEIIDFFKKECVCMAMEKHLKKLNGEGD
jgi:hypothetical protein